MTAADWQAIAEWVTAASVLAAGTGWLARHKILIARFSRRWRRKAAGVLSEEMTAGAAWDNVKQTPEVSMEAGIAFARTAARTGHPPYTVTQGRAAPEQPLDYLLSKTAEVVWDAVTSANSELEPYLVPLRNYMRALAAKAGLSEARDFALGVLTERVRQEEDGWPDHPGDRKGLRGPHGAGNRHACLLERKHDVENAIYEAAATAAM